MDDKTRRSLIKALSISKGFDSSYSGPNRLWFVEKLIRRLETEGLGDGAVEQKTSELVQKAKAIVKANRDFSVALTSTGNDRFSKRALKNMRRHRVEILYGAIAFDHQFVEPQHLNYLLFIAKRRFHGICRMRFWVNPNVKKSNRQGYFTYPTYCSADQRYRVNEDAEPFWERQFPPGDYPIKLEPQPNGALDPVVALTKIFVKKTGPCKVNVLDCSGVASLLFMESLLEAKDRDRFLKKLASKGTGYLIIHQLGSA